MYHYAANNPVRYVDPDGRVFNLVAAAAGIVIGAGAGAAVAWKTGGSGKDIASAALGGAAGGALAGFTCGASFAVAVGVGGAAIAVGAVVAAGTDIAINVVQGNDVLDGVDKAALGGGLGGGVGYVAGVAIGATVPKASKTGAEYKNNKFFPENPDDFNPEGLTRYDFKNGEIKKWINNDNKAIYEWNKDLKYGDHYHYTPDGKNRIPNINGNTHLQQGEPVP